MCFMFFVRNETVKSGLDRIKDEFHLFRRAIIEEKSFGRVFLLLFFFYPYVKRITAARINMIECGKVDLFCYLLPKLKQFHELAEEIAIVAMLFGFKHFQ